MALDLMTTTWTDRKSQYMIEVATVSSDGGISFAVRNGFGDCLNKDGAWEFEPRPSRRTKEFLERCRFLDFNEAANMLEKAVEE